MKILLLTLFLAAQVGCGKWVETEYTRICSKDDPDCWEPCPEQCLEHEQCWEPEQQQEQLQKEGKECL